VLKEVVVDLDVPLPVLNVVVVFLLSVVFLLVSVLNEVVVDLDVPLPVLKTVDVVYEVVVAVLVFSFVLLLVL
tara:strand:- start:4657 stop:4875 length:219 start_codon:yes stop_codon:yes gene_type:complete